MLLVRNGLLVLVAAVLLVAGAWTSWGSAQYAMGWSGREHGTVKVASCDDERCAGPFTPEGEGRSRDRVSLVKAASPGVGERVTVVLRPTGDRAVRTGPAGVLHAWVPFAGALLLAALVVAGGLRWRRTAWGMGLAGVALLVGAWVAL
ncbi:hypothetical protein [Streptomyces catenulae]|uniref:Integral membrane protein n=1 Tax=Streptomyces catenulae TaxID=66875 RepID=A0ABV2Z321_9ACTN|nr:hypothetical protein [Streptomyces catenulae]